ncbi:hypothetical protein EOM09_05350, partial [bacterium]|nr:hypothetical protein [bacterium]
MVKRVLDKLKCFFVIVFCFCNTLAFTTNDTIIKSSINNKILYKNNNRSYSFFAAGHLYGYPSTSVFVSPSLLSSLDLINANNVDFFVSLGDNFRECDSVNILNFKKSFAEKINCPFFITVGNHDVIDYNLYKNNFGNTWFSFFYSNDAFIFLDSEFDNSQISGEQLNFLSAKTEEIAANKSLRNVFVFCHKLLWTINDSIFQNVYNNTNEVGGYKITNNFSENVFPLLKKMSSDKNLYFISGDIGVELIDKRWGGQIFYHKLLNSNITYIANGIGDNYKDVILKINVNENGNAEFNLFPLTDYKWDKIENYGVEFWNNYFKNKPEFSFENNKSNVISNKELSLTEKIKNIIKNKYFFFGLLVGSFIILL